MRVCADARLAVVHDRRRAAGRRRSLSRSASSRMIAADLPPSSSVTRLSCSPQMRGDAPAGGGAAGEADLVDAGVAHQVLADLAAGRHDVDTPGGMPASIDRLGQQDARRAASPAPASAPPSQPAASAGPSFSMVMNCGTFHGTIAAATPTGSRRTSAGPSMPGAHLLERVLARQAGEVVEHHVGGHHLAHVRERDRRAHLGGDGRRHLGRRAPAARASSRAIDVGALGRRHARPRPVVEGRARRGDGAVDVGLARLGDAGDHLLACAAR